MKVVIAGSRSLLDYKTVIESVTNAINTCNFNITEVVCGLAIGVDRIGQQWAILNGIPVKEMPADWNRYGKAAGPIRNMKMAEYADAAIIVWDGKSPGALSMIKEIKKAKKPYFIDVIVRESDV